MCSTPAWAKGRTAQTLTSSPRTSPPSSAVIWDKVYCLTVMVFAVYSGIGGWFGGILYANPQADCGPDGLQSFSDGLPYAEAV